MSTSCLASESQPTSLEGLPQLKISLDQKQQLLCLDHHPNWQIGRGKKNQIILPSKSVSRLHATIELVPVGNLYFAYFSDAGSLNGSFVNQRPVLDRIFLLDGDVITLGDATLTFHYPAQRTQTQLDAFTDA
ncbi:MAG: FHA domain-containing protein [Aphanocapsa sp. GSE-SYN-MK-11-07L]|jgi:pSer/pThr/pTyr-binding forkhead associated (FHA) protein|nr:FHA domain-containing protein [Aphanocapsa sp. GSE-SYN-MK-11-07L]